MRKIVGEPSQTLQPDNVEDYARTALASHECFVEARSVSPDDLSSTGSHYIRQLQSAITSFEEKRKSARLRYVEHVTTAKDTLRGIDPPSRRKAPHRDLIAGLECGARMIEQQSVSARAGDQVGLEEATRELVVARERVKMAIQRIRSWRGVRKDQ
ncbi:MAG: hypothetical protein WA484_10930 [Solirubrobacteraceae bacterium]